jgi:pyruvate,water dikinase
VAREFGIPAVVGTGAATSRIPEGARVLVDGDTGVVEILASSGRDGEQASRFDNALQGVNTEVGEGDAGAGHQILHRG